ncbi:CBS domain-containing protein [Caldithrix abyssi]|uniref:CBS domain-containing protein n=1 Tax=Caldithrix abyssi DSM 13497 TaxID=880073 RepID=H1XNE4_CALAY|nr:CBS domain-containing protein [Caldithrix abyssi]APF18075.1 CBS domain-containing protein [Caldithrix abyssi DSM 13497]EHO42115.1 putative signal transduction protein with CBS domains [Caldithrix abyssi DSM 13497]
MKSMRTILMRKGHQIYTIDPEATVLEALQKMADKNVGALLVVKDGQVKGIISERDCARKLDIKGRCAKDTPVKDIMTTHVLFLDISNTAEEAMAIMINKRIRHLPVYEDKKLVGIISIGDVVKAIIEDQKFTIEQLENYIMGTY